MSRHTITAALKRQGCSRYVEHVEQGAEPTIRQLDLSPTVLDRLGYPDTLTVTVKAKEQRSGGGIVRLGGSDESVIPAGAHRTFKGSGQ